MTILDKVNAKSRSIIQNYTDNEPANYIEAGMIYQIVLTGRFQVAMLNVLYNHAENQELKALIKDAITSLVERTIKYSEDFLIENDTALPNTRFSDRPLENVQEIPSASHFSDMEISLILLEMNGTSQTALLTAISQCYHMEIGAKFRKEINMGFDWAYRLQHLMLTQHWLPEVAKINKVLH